MASNNEVEFIELIRALWIKKWFIVLVTATVSIIFSIVQTLIPDTFTGELR